MPVPVLDLLSTAENSHTRELSGNWLFNPDDLYEVNFLSFYSHNTENKIAGDLQNNQP